MTAFTLRNPLEQEMSEQIARLGLLVACGDGLTAEEVRDLREWLKAARQQHWNELRECRGKRWEAAIGRFKERAGAGEPQQPLPREEGKLPERYADDARPSDSEGAA